MTEKQIERVQTKIKRIKSALAVDKKRHGGYYDDSRGLRYTPTRLYIQIADFSGGLKYLNWFSKNFPDDGGYPDFLFEWTIILFKSGRLKEAEKKAFETHCSNTYLFDTFFGKPSKKIEMWESSNLETQDFAENNLCYTHQQDQLNDFAAWLDAFISTEKFVHASSQFVDIKKQLATTKAHETRHRLMDQLIQLEEGF